MSANVATPSDVLTVDFRPAGADDWAYITDSWARSSHTRSSQIRHRIDRLRRRKATFLIACDPQERRQILGWACLEKPVLHYIFVKLPFRNQGIARQLLSSLADQRIILCTGWTSDARKIARKHPIIRRLPI